MKVESTKEQLLEVIATADRFTGKNLSLPSLGFVFLEAKGGVISARATNLELGIEITRPVKVIKPGSVVVPGGVLAQFLGNLSDGSTVVVEEVGGNISVDSKNFHSLIKAVPADDFPALPKVKKEKELKLPGRDLIRGFKSVYWGAAASSVKPELGSVYLNSENNTLLFAATDSFRLAEKRISTEKIVEVGPTLIPMRNVSELIKVLEGVGEVEVGIGGGQASFSFGGVYLVSRTIDGTFPDYKQIIPKEGKTEVLVLKQDFLQALKMAGVFSDSFNQVVFRVIPKEKLFEIQTENARVGENASRLEGTIKGDDVTLSFNHRYVGDCLQSIEADSLELSFNGPGKPLVIRGVGDSTFTYLVMPMNK